MCDRVKIPTTYPMPPDRLVEQLNGLVRAPQGRPHLRGLPGMVRNGHVLGAPHFVTEKGPAPSSSPSW